MSYLLINLLNCYKVIKQSEPANSVWKNYQAPNNWKENLAELIYNHLTPETKAGTTLSRILGHVKSHANSNPDEFIRTIKRIHAVFGKLVVDPSLYYDADKDATVLAEKLLEGLENCPSGCQDRVYAIWKNWQVEKNMPERIQRYKQELVDKVARTLYNEVHAQNYVTVVAAKMTFGTTANNTKDSYTGTARQNNIKTAVTAAFDTQFTPLLMIKAIEEQLYSQLIYRGYVGRKPGYVNGDYDSWITFLKEHFPGQTIDYEWLVMDDNYESVVDIDWTRIRQAILNALITEGCLRTNDGKEAELSSCSFETFKGDEEFNYWASVIANNEALTTWCSALMSEVKFNKLLRLHSALPKDHPFHPLLKEQFKFFKNHTGIGPYINALTTLPQGKAEYVYQLINEFDEPTKQACWDLWYDQLANQRYDSKTYFHHYPVMFGCLPLVQRLVAQKPAWMEFKDQNGQTPLLWAAANGHEDILEYLIKHKQDNLNIATEVKDGYRINREHPNHGRTPLHWAATGGHHGCVEKLLAAGANPRLKLSSLQYMPIHLAVRSGHFEITKLFIDRYPDLLNVKDYYNQTPLLWAATKGHEAILDYLLQKGAALEETTKNAAESKSQNGRTALYWAILNGRTACATKLIEAGASFQVNPITQLHAMHHAVLNNRLEIVKALLAKDPSVINHPDKRLQTPLLKAAELGHTEILQYLISQGASLSAVTTEPMNKISSDSGKTALHWAAEKGHLECVKCLLEAGADVEKTTSLMTSRPIHLAAQNGHLDIVKALLEKNPELINQPDNHSQTPLLWAASKGHTELVEYLISKGADLNVATTNSQKYAGKTPLHWAIENGHSDIVCLLLKQNTPLALPRSIDKSKLNHKARIAVSVYDYIEQRSKKADYYYSFTLFSHTFNFGISKEKKLAAANALKEVVMNDQDKSSLQSHRKALNNGELHSVYRQVKF